MSARACCRWGWLGASTVGSGGEMQAERLLEDHRRERERYISAARAALLDAVLRADDREWTCRGGRAPLSRLRLRLDRRRVRRSLAGLLAALPARERRELAARMDTAAAEGSDPLAVVLPDAPVLFGPWWPSPPARRSGAGAGALVALGSTALLWVGWLLTMHLGRGADDACMDSTLAHIRYQMGVLLPRFLSGQARWQLLASACLASTLVQALPSGPGFWLTALLNLAVVAAAFDRGAGRRRGESARNGDP